MKNKKVLIPVIALAVVLIFAIVVVALGSGDNGLVAKNVYVLDAEVGGKTVDEATEIITKEYMEANPKLEVICGENKAEISFSDFGQIDFDATAQKAYSVGRGNIFKRAFTKLTSFKKRTVSLSMVVDEKLLNKKVDEAFSADGLTYGGETYRISEDKLIVTAGHSGEIIEVKNIKDVIENLENNLDTQVVAENTYKEYEGVDVDALYEKVCREPADAYYDKEGGKLVPHVVGYKFYKEEAGKILGALKENEQAEITLTVTMPEVLDADLTGTMFKDVLASYSTNYNPGEVDRSYNMLLAARKVNGTVLEPGAVFSYNRVVGERTVAAGYRNAKIFENGRVVDGLAGGICQVSSTIYNAALYANMGIVERKNHSFPVAYTPKGQDATVAMGFIDFKFKNTNSRPVKITATVSGGICRVEILGIKEENFKVEIVNNIISQKARPVTYEEDPTLEKGVEKVTQTGNDGYTVTTTRYVYVNGQLVKTEKMPTSYYTPLEKIIKRNTAEEEPPAEEPSENEGEVVDVPQEQPQDNPQEPPADVPVDVPPAETQPETPPEVTEPEVTQPEATPETVIPENNTQVAE